MKVKLAIESPSKFAGVALLMTHSPFVIGRDPGCDLRGHSSALGARHCALVVRDHKLYVEDFPDSTGTFVNDERVEQSREVHHLDHVQAGKIRFTIQFMITGAHVPTLAHAAENGANRDNAPAPAPAAPVPRSESAEIAALLLSGEDSPQASSEPETPADTAPDVERTQTATPPPDAFAAKTKPTSSYADETAAAASNMLMLFRKHGGAAMVEKSMSSSQRHR